MNPVSLQTSTNPPMQEPFLNDDFGWVVGFSFSIPLVLSLAISIFVIGDVRSNADNWLYGSIGLIAGTLIGSLMAFIVKRSRDHKQIKQEKKGGFLIAVSTHNEEQHREVMNLLKKYRAQNIKIGEL